MSIDWQLIFVTPRKSLSQSRFRNARCRQRGRRFGHQRERAANQTPCRLGLQHRLNERRIDTAAAARPLGPHLARDGQAQINAALGRERRQLVAECKLLGPARTVDDGEMCARASLASISHIIERSGACQCRRQ